MIYKPPTPCQIFFFFTEVEAQIFFSYINQYTVKETIINTDAVVFLINIWIGFFYLFACFGSTCQIEPPFQSTLITI